MDIERYLDGLAPADRAALSALRSALIALLPGSIERISYGMPGLRLGGRMVAGYAATQTHLSFYPHSGTVLPLLAPDIAAAGLTHTKSALHFRPDQLIPERLLRAILVARLDEAGIAKPAALA